MNDRSTNASPRARTASILTDIHFWIPALVLLAGLLLLKLIS